MGRLVRAVPLVLLILWATGSVAGVLEDGLDAQAAQCEASIAHFREKVDTTTTLSNVFLLGGALISAIGAALAGILNANTQRKVAAVLGAAGAVATVLPKALPNGESLYTDLVHAEQHRRAATKVRNQFQFARPDESLVEAQKYVSARFTDCSSLTPPAEVPDPPMARSVGKETLALVPDPAPTIETVMAVAPPQPQPPSPSQSFGVVLRPAPPKKPIFEPAPRPFHPAGLPAPERH